MIREVELVFYDEADQLLDARWIVLVVIVQMGYQVAAAEPQTCVDWLGSCHHPAQVWLPRIAASRG